MYSRWCRNHAISSFFFNMPPFARALLNPTSFAGSLFSHLRCLSLAHTHTRTHTRRYVGFLIPTRNLSLFLSNSPAIIGRLRSFADFHEITKKRAAVRLCFLSYVSGFPLELLFQQKLTVPCLNKRNGIFIPCTIVFRLIHMYVPVTESVFLYYTVSVVCFTYPTHFRKMEQFLFCVNIFYPTNV